jgi:hypothetical protein
LQEKENFNLFLLQYVNSLSDALMKVYFLHIFSSVFFPTLHTQLPVMLFIAGKIYFTKLSHYRQHGTDQESNACTSLNIHILE